MVADGRKDSDNPPTRRAAMFSTQGVPQVQFAGGSGDGGFAGPGGNEWSGHFGSIIKWRGLDGQHSNIAENITFIIRTLTYWICWKI